MLGQTYLSEGDSAKALEAFNQAGSFDRTLPFPILGQAEALRGLGLFYEAEQLLVRAEEQYLRDIGYLTQIAAVHISNGNYEAAVRVVNAWNKLDKHAPHMPSQYNVEGTLKYEESNFGDAEALFREAYSRFANAPTVVINFAWCYRVAALYHLLPKPSYSWKSVPDNNLKNSVAVTCLGVIAFRKQQLSDSEGLLRSAMQSNRYGGASVSLASLLTSLGEYEEAERILRDNIARDRMDSASCLTLGKLLLETERIL